MQAFLDVLKRIDEVYVSPEYKDIFIEMIKDMNNYFSSQEKSLNLDFGKVFERFLYNNLTIRGYANTDEKISGEGGCFKKETNTICLNKNTDKTHLCHEFIHFIVHNQYAEEYFGKWLPLPTFLDEYATQKLAMEITNHKNISYKTMIDFVDFVNRHSSPKINLQDFINGKLNDGWENNTLFSNLASTFNKITFSSTNQLESKIVLGVLYEETRNFLNENKNASFDKLLQHLVGLECENYETGKIDGRWEAGFKLTKEDRNQFYVGSNIVRRFINSKNAKAKLDDKKAEEANQTVKNYVVAKLKENHNKYCDEYSKYHFKPEEEMALKDISKVKNMANRAAFGEENLQLMRRM